MSETAIIEINGVKLEVDLRSAKQIHDNIRVGGKVKLLSKANTYKVAEVFAGVVVGFENFPSLPTIVVAYITNANYDPKIEFAYINSGSADKWEMVPSYDNDRPIQKNLVLAAFSKERSKLERAIEELNQKEKYFVQSFGAYFNASEVI